ncbi:MAG TPA: xanthine dehydrogenase family protein molybdopterin-binding subunit [Acidimicrobiales bacterium]|nr:xanthine dehydrogenase family protein molybdopterin-binding subunit [Acidimicrobiales bacterium]
MGDLIGRSVPRVEDPALVTGQGRFLDDLDPFPGTVAAAVVRSPHPHARIVGFDAEAARAVPGVVAVVGPEEVGATLRPFPLSTPAPMPYLPAATDRVRYVGEPVAVVVATDRAVAEDAGELIEVAYEPLAAVVGAEGALSSDAPLVHPGAGTNVATDRTFSFGDVDAAFASADRVVAGRYAFPRYSSTPMECYVVIADWRDEADGPAVTIHANFHGPFTMAPVVAAGLGIPLSRLRLVVPPDIGGSFGIKSGTYPYLALVALASRYAGRPVRWVEDRIEHLLASSAGNDRVMGFEAAVSDDGVLSGLRVDLVDNVGAYLRPPEPSTLYRCYGNITGAYRIENVAIRSRAVVTNKAPTGLNRGFGGQQLYFGLERLMDRVAAQAGLDPVEVRRRNLVPTDAFPYPTATGGVYDSGDFQAGLALALERSDYEGLRAHQDRARRAGRLYGIGVATVVDPSGTNIGYVGLSTPAAERRPGRQKSGATEHVRLTIDPFGAVTVLLGTVPQGQGHATVARQVVADRLGLPGEAVHPVVELDTATTPWTVTTGSYSSRFSPLLTSALVAAADKAAARIKTAAGVLLDVEADALELGDGQVRVRDDPGRAVAFRHAAGLVHWDPGSLPAGAEPGLYVEAAFSPPQAQHADPSDRINSSLCYGFVAEVVAVEVDPDTLEVRIDRATSVHDSGTVLNPALVEGQVLGAIAHGLGGALFEELAYDEDGQPRSASFMDYLCPTAAEMAFPLTCDHLVSPSPFTALGAKGVGEGSSMSFPVAVANAVADALGPLGAEVDALPLHPGAIHDLVGGEVGRPERKDRT